MTTNDDANGARDWVKGYSQETAGGITAQAIGATVISAVTSVASALAGHPYISFTLAGAGVVIVAIRVFLGRRALRAATSPARKEARAEAAVAEKRYPFRVADLPSTRTPPARFASPGEILRFLKTVPSLQQKAVAETMYRGRWVAWQGRIEGIRDHDEYVSVRVETSDGAAYLWFAGPERSVVESLVESDSVTFEGQIAQVDTHVELVRLEIKRLVPPASDGAASERFLAAWARIEHAFRRVKYPLDSTFQFPPVVESRKAIDDLNRLRKTWEVVVAGGIPAATELSEIESLAQRIVSVRGPEPATPPTGDRLAKLPAEKGGPRPELMLRREPHPFGAFDGLVVTNVGSVAAVNIELDVLAVDGVEARFGAVPLLQGGESRMLETSVVEDPSIPEHRRGSDWRGDIRRVFQAMTADYELGVSPNEATRRLRLRYRNHQGDAFVLEFDLAYDWMAEKLRDPRLIQD
jgi:hypothetical protein